MLKSESLALHILVQELSNSNLRQGGYRPVDPVGFDESEVIRLIGALNIGVGVGVALQELVNERGQFAVLAAGELAMLVSSD